MRSIISFLFIQLFLVCTLSAQDDSAAVKPPQDTAVKHTTIVTADTVPKKPVVKKKPVDIVLVKPDTTATRQTLDQLQTDLLQKHLTDSAQSVVSASSPYGNFAAPYISAHPFFNTTEGVIDMPSRPYQAPNKDELFYIICATLLFLGILRVSFPKYFSDLFNVFWRSTRQKQIRDQLLQAGMTTLLFNIFFVFSLSLFAYLTVDHLAGNIKNPWAMFGICFLTIGAIYSVKYFILRLSGWIFGQEEAAASYAFIVFMINKILAILIIPFTLILAFSDEKIQQAAFSIAVISIIFILIYRFILAYSNLRNELKISGLHLLLYVAGFEIIPVLLIYRLLVDFFARSL